MNMMSKLRNMGAIKNQTKLFVEALNEEVNLIPEDKDHCEQCSGCRDRAETTIEGVRKYFKRFL